METPKNLVLVMYLIVWLSQRFSLMKLRQFRPHVVEVCLLAMLAASAVSTAFNWPFLNGLKGFWDMLRYVLLFWCIYRAGYSVSQHRTLSYFAIWGLVIGLAVALFEVATARRGLFELHSAGVLTQSAIYISIVFILVLGIFLTRWLPRGPEPRAKAPLWPWTLAMFAMLLALVAMGSRGALLALVLAVLFIAVCVNRARLWAALAVGIIFSVSAGFAMMKLNTAGMMISNIQARFASERLLQSDREHYENVRIALAQIHQTDSLWMGIGPRNYRSIDLSHLKFDPPLRLPGAQDNLKHAHNLFLTKLVEEGLLGLLAFLSLIGVVTYELFKAMYKREWYDWRWFAGFGALVVPVVSGMVNTPFYQEHAMLAMALMAIYVGSRRFPGVRSIANWIYPFIPLRCNSSSFAYLLKLLMQPIAMCTNPGTPSRNPRRRK
ncbi:MAG: O-antigen ligase family protein [Sulfuricaulis sp.]|nr:O-antigen ligase family protein [Sulfuricaulis sp.]